VTGTATTPVRHLRPRGGGAAQQTTTVELFFDLVYVFARRSSASRSPTRSSNADDGRWASSMLASHYPGEGKARGGN
jgi:hypothetical protein